MDLEAIKLIISESNYSGTSGFVGCGSTYLVVLKNNSFGMR